MASKSKTLKHCEDCGLDYDPSYKHCPFCEEDDGYRPPKRSKQRSSSFSLVTPTLIILILLMAGLLAYLLYGDEIMAKVKGETPPEAPPAASTEIVEDPTGSVIEPVAPSVSTQPPASSTTEPLPGEDKPAAIPYETIYALPAGLSLNKSDFTLPVGDPDVQLKASGGSGTYSWVSQDPNIATVDETGKVKAIARGTVNVLVSDGIRKGTCIVRVKGGSAPATTTAPSNPTAGSLSLNKTDYTTKVGEMDVLLTLGVTEGVLWETSNAAVATVNKGLVHAVGKGNCNITATYDGSTYTCIVRVKG